MAPEIRKLIISPLATLKQALMQMDEAGYKLLMIADKGNYFKGLITVGDIQRAIIANKSLDETAIHFCRQDLILGKTGDSLSEIKRQMIEYRLVYMPIINEKNQIEKVIYWEDILEEHDNKFYPALQLPIVIMAGGLGSRLKPLTNILPKPLLPFGDSTILENIIDRFKKYGCFNFEISVNYKADLIQFYFDSIIEKDYKVNFFSEDEPLGTAGSLHLLKDKLKTTFFVSNCDILIDEDYSAIHKYHVENKNELTIVASIKNYDIPYGTIESGENGQLISLKEKPQLDFMINCGMYILEPHLLKEIPANTYFHLTDLIEKIQKRNGKVGVFPISEKSWTDIGEWRSYSKILFQ
ncbi:MAG: nucleotidyltransferase family protein [Ginsengibacter sp.]